jgi:hypothetical protein
VLVSEAALEMEGQDLPGMKVEACLCWLVKLH